MLAACEEIARERGCRTLQVDTYSYQAPVSISNADLRNITAFATIAENMIASFSDVPSAPCKLFVFDLLCKSC